MADPLRIGFPVHFQDAINWARSREVVLPDEFYDRAIRSAQHQAFTVVGLTDIDQIRQVWDSMTHAIASGTSFKDWVTALEPARFGISPARAELIYRNSLQTAYSAGREVQLERNKDRRPYAMYDAVNDSRTRPAHRAMDGHIAPLDDPWWLTHTPPCGHRCRCTKIGLTEAEAVRRGYGAQSVPDANADPGWGTPPTQHEDQLQEMARTQASKLSSREIARAFEEYIGRGGTQRLNPVSEAFTLPEGTEFDPVRRGLAAVDAANDDGWLPATRVIFTSLVNIAEYQPRTSLILVAPSAEHVEEAVVHEVAHMLDLHAFGRGVSYESVNSAGVLSRVISAALKSRAADEWRAVALAEHRSYLLDPSEIWARAYTQWVAVRVGGEVGAQVSAIHRAEIGFWNTPDFEPILKEVEAAFRLEGWL